jgi:hypothetical protein
LSNVHQNFEYFDEKKQKLVPFLIDNLNETTVNPDNSNRMAKKDLKSNMSPYYNDEQSSLIRNLNQHDVEAQSNGIFDYNIISNHSK